MQKAKASVAAKSHNTKSKGVDVRKVLMINNNTYSNAAIPLIKRFIKVRVLFINFEVNDTWMHNREE